MKFDKFAFDIPLTDLEACDVTITGTEAFIEYCDEMIEEYELQIQGALNKWKYPEFFKEYNGQQELRTDHYCHIIEMHTQRLLVLNQSKQMLRERLAKLNQELDRLSELERSKSAYEKNEQNEQDGEEIEKSPKSEQ